MQNELNCTPKLVDARGLACPMPLLKAKQALSRELEGGRVCLLATDPGSVKDIRRFIELSPHSLVDFKQVDEYYEFILQRGSA